MTSRMPSLTDEDGIDGPFERAAARIPARRPRRVAQDRVRDVQIKNETRLEGGR